MDDVSTSRGGEVVAVTQESHGVRLDKWLASADRLGSRSRAADALLRGRVWWNDEEQTLQDAPRRLAAGDRVRIWIDRPGSRTRQGPRRQNHLDIVYEDQDLLVLAKPPGVLTLARKEQPEQPSLEVYVRDYWRSHGGRTPLAVHRLDRDTSGLVVFARSHHAQAKLRRQFADRSARRGYLAIVHGVPAPAAGEWRVLLQWDQAARRQRPAASKSVYAMDTRSRYRVVETLAQETSLVQVELVTGKRHQIRAQAWLAGHPLVGEHVYTGLPASEPRYVVPFDRQALHAARLAFRHPGNDEIVEFTRPPAADMEELLTRLRHGARRSS
jgi:23S rRNA pseudouridine1911/1915/1917 synthase